MTFLVIVRLSERAYTESATGSSGADDSDCAL
jgi:hypothetical protein